VNSADLFNQFQICQQQVLSLCQQAVDDYAVQYHPDLSPMGWHLGHCIYTEIYWIHEMFLADTNCDQGMTKLYNPALASKSERGQFLPKHTDLCRWAQKMQNENRQCLASNINHQDQFGLMQNNFLLHFLIQHYAQHFETMQMSRNQAALKNEWPVLETKLSENRSVHRSVNKIKQGTYTVGAKTHRLPYDNEYPAHVVEIQDMLIASKPVTNSEFLAFMRCNGYQEKKYWSDAGWRWRTENNIYHPEYWQADKHNGHYGISPAGPVALSANAPVFGISYYEAQAFADWAGARLPHEHEWEIAQNSGLLGQTGQVWEWCDNSFFPYPGFQAYPYDGYSLPYFDGAHYTLKGGSVYTRPVIRRPSFRNYYQANKRFLHAGMRLVFS
jgi:gamma-glutamyl hercynylcysteine S-oxide synthase